MWQSRRSHLRWRGRGRLCGSRLGGRSGRRRDWTVQFAAVAVVVVVVGVNCAAAIARLRFGEVGRGRRRPFPSFCGVLGTSLCVGLASLNL